MGSTGSGARPAVPFDRAALLKHVGRTSYANVLSSIQKPAMKKMG